MASERDEELSAKKIGPFSADHHDRQPSRLGRRRRSHARHHKSNFVIAPASTLGKACGVERSVLKQADEGRED